MIATVTAFDIGAVIVNYNGWDDTVECIESLLRSQFAIGHIIVVDNCSSDDAPEVLIRNERVTLLLLGQNFGFGVANNIGVLFLRLLGVHNILLINNDAVVDSDSVRHMVLALKQNRVVTCAIYYYSDPQTLWYGGGTIRRNLCRFDHMNYDDSRPVSFVSGCCLMLNIQTVDKVGLFEPEYFMYYEDADFSIRALSTGVELWYEHSASVFHKVGRTSSRDVGLRDYYLTRNRFYVVNQHRASFSVLGLIYLYSTRVLRILAYRVAGRNVGPILDGIRDYRKGIMGRR